MDTKNVSTWLSGQLKTSKGDIVKFEFSPDLENGGGVVRIAESSGAPDSEIDHNALHVASGVFGTKMKELLVGGCNLFTQVRVDQTSVSCDPKIGT